MGVNDLVLKQILDEIQIKEFSELRIEEKINGSEFDGIKQMESEGFMAKRMEYGYKRIFPEKMPMS